MKWLSIMLLIVMALTVLAPISSFSLIAVNDGKTFFGSIDVCHDAAPALSANGDMPCVSVSPCSFIPVHPVLTEAPAHLLFTDLLLSSRNEQPPRS